MTICRPKIPSCSVRYYCLIMVYFVPVQLTVVLSPSKELINDDQKPAAASSRSLWNTTSLHGNENLTLMRMEPVLPVCTVKAICSKTNNFTGVKQVHRICNCPTHLGTDDSRKNDAEEPKDGECRHSMNTSDGFTFENDGQYYTMCKPIRAIPECRFFHDTTYVITTYPSRSHIQQTVRCICPNGSSTYVTKWMQKHKGPYGKIIYHFACAPPPQMECSTDEPCAIFINSAGKSTHKQTACRCPSGTSCPETLMHKGKMPERIQNAVKIRKTEYLIVLTVEADSYLILEIMNITSQTCWKSRFERAQLESVTEEAGILKRFSCFIAMLRAALFQTSQNVSLDIRSTHTPANVRPSLFGRDSMSSQSSSSNTSSELGRILLVLSFQSEFENCIYTLPLERIDPSGNESRERPVGKPFHPVANSPGLPETHFVEKGQNPRRAAVVHLENCIESLRIEKQITMKDLETTKTRLRKSEARELSLIEDAERLKRQVGKQLLGLKSQCEERIQQFRRETKLLTHELSIARREISTLKVQLRRAQAQNALHERSHESYRQKTRPSKPSETLRQHSPQCYLRRNQEKSAADNKDRQMLYVGRPTGRQLPGPNRTHSADAFRGHRPNDAIRSRSYSPSANNQKPRFELHIIKHSSTESLDNRRKGSLDRAYQCSGNFHRSGAKYTTDARSTSPSLAASPGPFRRISKLNENDNAKGDCSRRSSPLFVLGNKTRIITPSPTRPLFPTSKFSMDSDDDITAQAGRAIMDDVSARAKVLLQKYRKQDTFR